MSAVVDFGKVQEINSVLKEKGIEYRVHTIGGCTCSELEIIKKGKESSLDEIIKIINETLKSKYIYVYPRDDNPYILNVESVFE